MGPVAHRKRKLNLAQPIQQCSEMANQTCAHTFLVDSLVMWTLYFYSFPPNRHNERSNSSDAAAPPSVSTSERCSHQPCDTWGRVHCPTVCSHVSSSVSSMHANMLMVSVRTQGDPRGPIETQHRRTFIHRHPCISILVRTLPDIMHSLSLTWT